MSAKKALKDVINHAKSIRVARGTAQEVRALAADVEKLAGAVLQLERDRASQVPAASVNTTDGSDVAVGALPPWRPGAAALSPKFERGGLATNMRQAVARESRMVR
jgi:hypothetical protein